jgi:sigma-E factor negative regulatory protein RseC
MTDDPESLSLSGLRFHLSFGPACRQAGFGLRTFSYLYPVQESIRNIEHPGIVDRVEGRQAFVRILPQSACGSCHSKSYCSMSEVSEKIVEVGLREDDQIGQGEQVTITLERSLGFRALFLGYMLPFLILLVSLFVLVSLTGNEGLSALTRHCPHGTLLRPALPLPRKDKEQV